MKRVTPVASIVAGLLMVLSLTACGDKSASGGQEMALSPTNSAFINTDVTGLGYARDFALTDHTGKPRTLADYKGKAVLVFFGYTQCPDVCPTTMVEMANVMKEMGPLASKVQVLFVTVDPERDTQELLSKYVPAFDPSFVGLYGDQAATDKVAKEFRVFYQKVPGKTPGSYTMDHTAGSYVFDPEGHIRLFVRHGQGPEPIAHDLKLLLK
ncbi:SCO family protein [Collimonas sp.]|jgi:protein SCO1/2|uniref:SCO family protein n=1 Tax=Collimonas sp. TaxID=1963772 RepID=UPI0039C875A3